MSREEWGKLAEEYSDIHVLGGPFHSCLAELEKETARVAVLREVLGYYSDLKTWELLEQPSGSVNGGTIRARRLWFEDMRKVDGAPNEPGRRAEQALATLDPEAERLLARLRAAETVCEVLSKKNPRDMPPLLRKAMQTWLSFSLAKDDGSDTAREAIAKIKEQKSDSSPVESAGVPIP